MAAAIEVNKQTVKQLLETGKNKKFVIPEYQRPYAWTADQIQTLFDDLVEYTESTEGGNGSEGSTYFWGLLLHMKIMTMNKKLLTVSNASLHYFYYCGQYILS